MEISFRLPPIFFDEPDLELPVGFFYLFDFRVGQNLDILVIVHIIHLRGFNADGTIIGRKGFVEACHHAPDTGGVIHQIYLCAIFSRVHGAIDTGNSSPDYKYCIAHILTSKNRQKCGIQQVKVGRILKHRVASANFRIPVSA
jgi:hypothetical protein